MADTVRAPLRIVVRRPAGSEQGGREPVGRPSKLGEQGQALSSLAARRQAAEVSAEGFQTGCISQLRRRAGRGVESVSG